MTEKFAHSLGDETAEVFQGEVPCINQVQFGVREISSVGVGTFDGEERIVLSPEDQHSRLVAAKILMPTVVEPTFD